MTPEQAAHKAIQREMAGKWFSQRIERNTDVPDIYFKFNGCRGWIELKAASDNEAIKLRHGQINWISRHGAGAYLIIRQLDNKRRHRHWIGLDSRQVLSLRHLHRPTPDMVVASLQCTVGITFMGVLEALIDTDKHILLAPSNKNI